MKTSNPFAPSVTLSILGLLLATSALAQAPQQQQQQQQHQCQQQNDPYKNLRACRDVKDVREGYCNAIVIAPTFSPEETSAMYEVASLSSVVEHERVPCGGGIIPFSGKCIYTAGVDESKIKTCTTASIEQVECTRTVSTGVNGRDETRTWCSALTVIYKP